MYVILNAKLRKMASKPKPVEVLQPLISGMWSQQKSDDLMAQMAARLALLFHF